MSYIPVVNCSNRWILSIAIRLQRIAIIIIKCICKTHVNLTIAQHIIQEELMVCILFVKYFNLIAVGIAVRCCSALPMWLVDHKILSKLSPKSTNPIAMCTQINRTNGKTTFTWANIVKLQTEICVVHGAVYEYLIRLHREHDDGRKWCKERNEALFPLRMMIKYECYACTSHHKTMESCCAVVSDRWSWMRGLFDNAIGSARSIVDRDGIVATTDDAACTSERRTTELRFRMLLCLLFHVDCNVTCMLFCHFSCAAAFISELMQRKKLMQANFQFEKFDLTIQFIMISIIYLLVVFLGSILNCKFVACDSIHVLYAIMLTMKYRISNT